MHFDARSNCLLSNLSFSLKLHITSFSWRQRLHDFDKILYPEDFLHFQHILQQISMNIKTALNENQWWNLSLVIKWFKNIKNKNLHIFTMFDIQEFYPSISEKLLKDAVLFAQTHANTNRKDIEVIFHCCRSLLFHDNEP